MVLGSPFRVRGSGFAVPGSRFRVRARRSFVVAHPFLIRFAQPGSLAFRRSNGSFEPCINRSRGDGSIAIPRAAHYSSNAWTKAGGDTLGDHAADTAYPEIVASESIKLLPGAGPAGENVLTHHAADGVSSGWWNAQSGPSETMLSSERSVNSRSAAGWTQ
jgi:hypothetical protein